MANGRKKTAPKKQRMTRRELTVRIVAGACAFLMILSVLLSVI